MRLIALENMSQGDMLILVLLVSVSAVLMGFLTDAIMGQAGFGPIGNGLIVGLAGVVGVHYRAVVFGAAASQHSYTIAISAVGMATLILIVFGFLKRATKG